MSLRFSVLVAAAIACGTSTSSFAADAAASKPASAQRADPPPECMAVLDELSRDVPPRETGPALRSTGLKIRSPILVPEGVITERHVVSGARVRVMIDSKGQVVPGTVTVQRSVGDPKLPIALSQAVPATLSFDVSGAFKAPAQFAFTTVYVVCASSQ